MPAHNFTARPGFGNCLTADTVIVREMATLPPSRHPSTGMVIYHGVVCRGYLLLL